MTLCAAAKYPIREDLVKIHAGQFAQLGQPGTWGSAPQRQAVCLEAREACYDAGMLQRPADAQTPAVQLPEVAKRLVRKLAAEPQGFEEADYQEALIDTLSVTYSKFPVWGLGSSRITILSRKMLAKGQIDND
jgi:hypothetical protein